MKKTEIETDLCGHLDLTLAVQQNYKIFVKLHGWKFRKYRY